MSAIAGFWRFCDESDPAADCARMLAAQQIYGPHDVHQWSEGPLAMGRRLFRTLPEDVHDRQPLQSRDGRLTLVADVRVDNRDELAAALGLSSAAAQKLCDAAILLESIERWGERALDRLVGDFAFALWDAAAQSLLLARDFLGQRPLHYHRGRNFFAFASMPKGLHALPDIPRIPDEQMVTEFLALMPQRGSRSFFKDIERVESAHIVTVTRDGASSRCYWQPQRPSAVRRPPSDYVDGVRHHLDRAVQSRLRGTNGVVGSQLSGGLDSAAVTATAARLLAPIGGKVTAFTAVPRQGYNGPNPRNRIGDEGPLAAATAAMNENVEHVLIRSSHISPLDGIERSFFLCDCPLLTPANIGWINAISKAARERKLNIMLVGTMGNMSLSYNGLEWLPELLRTGRLITLYRVASQLIANSGMRRRGALVQIFGPYTPVWVWQWANKVFLGDKRDILDYTAIRPERLAEFHLAALASERDLDFSYRPRKDAFASRLWVMHRVDQGNYNMGMLGGWGVDQRDPMADKRLVEYCLSVPTEEYIANGIQRALAKRALADRLPQAVLNEQRKGYQAADWHEALTAIRSDIAAELEHLADYGPAANALDIERMKRLIENWPTSGWERESVMRSYRQALLRGMSAGHFLRKASGANR